MFVDLRDNAIGSEIPADICVIGAGAAGISVARSFLDKPGIAVCVLESGGLRFDAATADLNAGESVGQAETGLFACRSRFFGGSTNCWGGWSRRFDDIDFVHRPWVPYSGWPFGPEKLEGYYDRAYEICELGACICDPRELDFGSFEFPDFAPEKVAEAVYQFSPPTRFGLAYKDELERAKNVKVCLYANATQLEANESASRVETVRVRTLDGKTIKVRARYVVLATGAIENARILLSSNEVQQVGLGNGNDMVGRFYAQHVELDAARILAPNAQLITSIFDRKQTDRTPCVVELMLAEKAQEKYETLNWGLTIHKGSPKALGQYAMKSMWKDIKNFRWPEEFDDKMSAVMADLSGAAAVVLGQGDLEPGVFELKGRCEQAPNPDSRVVLGDGRDALGQRRVKVDWRLTDAEWQTYRTGIRVVAEEFGRLGLGKIRISELLDAERPQWPPVIFGGCHQLGTTRMSDSAQTGVVNADCRVHTVENLYVAGGSVFPTVGVGAPTVMLVALALRLSDHLKTRLA